MSDIYPMKLTISYTQNYLVEAESEEEAAQLLDDAYGDDVIDPCSNCEIKQDFVTVDSLSDQEKSYVLTTDSTYGIDKRDALMEDLKSAKAAEWRIDSRGVDLETIASQAQEVRDGRSISDIAQERGISR